MADVLTRSTTLTTEECIVCGTVFALSKRMRDHLYERGGYFYCPVGHSQGWDQANCKNGGEKLQAEIAKLKASVKYKDDQIEAERKKASAAKGQLTKERNRTKNGVCPCCNRSFQNLRRHIDTKHPEFAK